MTRRSRREIEKRLDDLAREDVDGESSDVGLGVTAPFVTYEDDPADPPERVAVTEVDEYGGAAYRVVRQTDEAEGIDRR